MSLNLSEAFKPHPVYLHDDDHINFDSVQEVPDSHAWPQVVDYLSDLSDVDSVPIIDLMDPNAATLVGNACETWGVFQVINHGIPIHLLEDLESVGRRLFQLPAQQKLKVARGPDGMSGYGRARISCFFPKLLWSEGFTIFGSPIEQARQLWPQEYTTFCDVTEEYQKEMKRLSTRLMWIMLGSLGITEDDLSWAGPKNKYEGPCAALQLNSYPPCPDPKIVMGLAAHTDSTLLTVLYQTNTSGLQVFRDGGRWVTVPPKRGALVINVGDLLQILSNGRFPSVLHRAVVHQSRHRLSFAYLCGPPSNIQISPLPKLIDQKHPPLYHPVTWNEYLGIKYKHLNQALSVIRLFKPQDGSVDMNDMKRMKVGC
ncbi:Gibberellin 3-beta-dioxygenase [Thalictrum thalictroides]|uniref:gibberellin 3beta-dioxygenase n=1 Tax=Thalictrum thalictroides TaxID=46969 RepID=A0A7J6XEW6_THATH|nr:Gibberellin 3-beta-dioxygenase [Thalictrum thalictroides]